MTMPSMSQGLIYKLAGAQRFGCQRGSYGFDEDFGIATARFVFIAARGREHIGRGFDEAAFLLKISKRLRREREDFFRSFFRGERFGKAHQLAAVALVTVALVHIKARELGFALVRKRVQRDAADKITVNLEHPIVLDMLQNIGACAADEFLAFDRLPDERHDGANIFFKHTANLLIFVRVIIVPMPVWLNTSVSRASSV